MPVVNNHGGAANDLTSDTGLSRHRGQHRGGDFVLKRLPCEEARDLIHHRRALPLVRVYRVSCRMGCKEHIGQVAEVIVER